MRIFAFIPRGLTIYTSGITGKITEKKIYNKQAYLDRSFVIWQDNGILWGQMTESDPPTQLATLLNFFQFHDDIPTMLLFLGHGPQNACTDNTIASNNPHNPGMYLIDDAIWIARCLYGSIERKHLSPDSNKICLFNCWSGAGYDVHTNRVMYTAEQMKSFDINTRIKGTKGMLNVSPDFQMYNAGCTYVNDIFKPPTNLSIRAVDTYHPTQISEKALFIGIVENKTTRYEEKILLDEQCANVASPFSQRVSRCYPIAMNDAYIINFKRTEFLMLKTLKEYKGWGDDILQNEFEGQPLLYGTLEIQKRCVPVNSFLNLYFEYLNNLMTANRDFALASVVRLQELAIFVPTNFSSLNSLHNKLLPIFFNAAREYRNLMRITLQEDCKFINDLDQIDANINVEELLLTMPERSYYTIWHWTAHLLNTNTTFVQMNERSPGRIIIEDFQPKNPTICRDKTVAVFVQAYIAGRRTPETVIISVPLTMQSQAEIKTHIVEKLRGLGFE